MEENKRKKERKKEENEKEREKEKRRVEGGRGREGKVFLIPY